jgi:peptidoglycan/LPS O-acetylase OafA/YrhL
MKTAYRPDIDGLRAVAVLAVLFYHLGFSEVPGGYVGVDIFFVISGYLITNIILREVQSGDFSIVRFYERRVRRIFPALFVVMAVTLVAGIAFLIPDDLNSLGQSTSAVTVFASNVLFWNEVGYFDAPAEHKPLLHTWSLAVEEQFYIAFPLFLLAIRRFLRARFGLWLCVAAGASFAAGIYGTAYHPAATFYLVPTRAWELLIGALIACDVFPQHTNATLRNAVAVAGLFFILASIGLYSADMPFPGLAALLPTTGAAIIIHAGCSGGTWIGKVLSFRPLVFVGLISYSLYLLHWPMIVFAKHLAIVGLTDTQKYGLLFSSVALSAISWRFVEQPFRSKAIGRHHVFALAGTAMVTAVAAAGLIQASDGIPQRFESVVIATQRVLGAESYTAQSCDGQPGIGKDHCTFGARNVQPSFVLWGDSHAQALAIGLGRSAEAHSASGYIATAQGCPPMLGIAYEPYRWCLEYNDSVFDYIRQRRELRTVVLAARWALFADGRRYKNEEGAPIKLMDFWNRAGSPADNAQLFETGLARTVQRLAEMGRHVVLVEQVPEIGYQAAQAYAAAYRTGRDVTEIIAPSRQEYETRNKPVLAAFSSVRELDGVEVLKVTEQMCDNLKCKVIESGQSLYSDDDHLSVHGSRYLAPLFDRLFDRSISVARNSDAAQ